GGSGEGGAPRFGQTCAPGKAQVAGARQINRAQIVEGPYARHGEVAGRVQVDDAGAGVRKGTATRNVNAAPGPLKQAAGHIKSCPGARDREAAPAKGHGPSPGTRERSGVTDGSVGVPQTETAPGSRHQAAAVYEPPGTRNTQCARLGVNRAPIVVERCLDLG